MAQEWQLITKSTYVYSINSSQTKPVNPRMFSYSRKGVDELLIACLHYGRRLLVLSIAARKVQDVQN